MAGSKSEAAKAESHSASALGDRIRDLRRDRNLTQSELAGTDYSVSYISAIERNKIRPSLRALAWLASRLGIQLPDLLTGQNIRLIINDTTGTSSEPDLQVILAQAQMDIAEKRYTNARDDLLKVRDSIALPSQRTESGLLLGEAYIGLNQANEAKDVLEHNLTLTREIDPEMHERSRNLLGVAYGRLSMYMLAAECHRQCLAAIDSGIVRDPSFELSVLYNLGNDYMLLGQFADAITILVRATHLGLRLQSPQEIARLYWEISGQFRANGMVPQAQHYAAMATEHLGAAMNRQIFAQTQSNLGLAYAEQKDTVQAEATLSQARDLADRVGDAQGRSVALASLSRVQLTRGAANEARHSAEEALKSAKESGSSDSLGRAHLALGEALAAGGKIDAADEHFQQGLQFLESSSSASELQHAYERYADLLEQRGDVKRALDYLKRARTGAATH